MRTILLTIAAGYAVIVALNIVGGVILVYRHRQELKAAA